MCDLFWLTILWVRNSGKAGLDSLSLICVASAREAGMEGSAFQGGFFIHTPSSSMFLASFSIRLTPTLMSFCSGSSTELWLLAAWQPWSHQPLLWQLRAPRWAFRAPRGMARLLTSVLEHYFGHSVNQASHLSQRQEEGNETPQPHGRNVKESVVMFIPLPHFYVLNKEKVLTHGISTSQINVYTIYPNWYRSKSIALALKSVIGL